MIKLMNTSNSGAIEKDRTLIDRITYLASLSSEDKVIDPMLDLLRHVTAKWNSVEPLEKSDRARLDALELELKDFLIKKDPLRSFTAEDLEDRLRLRETKQSKANSYGLAVVASVGLASLVFLIPSSRLTLEYKALIAACAQMLISQLITVWFYLSNLNNFKKEFRKAFFYISLGILPLGVLFGQIGLVEILGVGGAAPFRYAGVSYFATAAFVIMYLGLRKYASLLKIRTKVSSFKNILPVAGIVAIVMILIPHASHAPHELFFDISLASIMVAFVFAGANAMLIHKIMHLVTSAYRKPLLILYIYMYAGIFGTFVAGGAIYLLGELSGSSLAIVILFAAIPQQLLLMYSGYQFEKHIGR